ALRGLRAAGGEQRGEARRVVGRHDGVVVAVEQQDAATGERAGGGGVIEHDHGAQQDGGGDGRLGDELQEGGGDVGPVGKTDGGEGGQPVVRGGGGHERGEFAGARGDLGGIEHALGEAGEKAVGPVLGNAASRREQG